jgi:hypothetical protein
MLRASAFIFRQSMAQPIPINSAAIKISAIHWGDSVG